MNGFGIFTLYLIFTGTPIYRTRSAPLMTAEWSTAAGTATRQATLHNFYQPLWQSLWCPYTCKMTPRSAIDLVCCSFAASASYPGLLCRFVPVIATTSASCEGPSVLRRIWKGLISDHLTMLLLPPVARKISIRSNIPALGKNTTVQEKGIHRISITLLLLKTQGDIYSPPAALFRK